ncbi:MAG: hypothetical protein GQ477_05925 [Nanohaloarchaea archaeon]|nr:hypothetical protein [Candidatus Nanohaloarchaea archaeon]
MVERTELELIPEELIGKDANIENEIYTDAYLEQINNLYPLDDVVGSRKAGIAKGKWKDLNHFTIGSPLHDSDAEDILNSILYNSANTGIWQPKRIKLVSNNTAKEYIEKVDRNDTVGIAKKRGFVYLTSVSDDIVFVLPTQSFVEYCISQNE